MGKIRAYVVFISAIFLVVEFCLPIISSTKHGGIDGAAQPPVQKTGSDKRPLSHAAIIRKTETFLAPFADDDGRKDIIRERERDRHSQGLKQKGGIEGKPEAKKQIEKSDALLRQAETAGKRRSVAFIRD